MTDAAEPLLDIEPEQDCRSWEERAAQDAMLRAFVQAEVARAGVAEAAWRAEATRWEHVAKQLAAKLDALRTPEERARENDKARQAAARRVRSPSVSGD